MHKHDFRVEDPGYFQTHYDRTKTRVGVVHLGVGAFHRAHQAVYIDNYMDKSKQLGWAIAGVNLRRESSLDLRRLKHRNGEYFLKTLAANSDSRFQLVRSHKSFFDWTENPHDAEQVIAQSTVQIISVTVTESGYFLGEDGLLDVDKVLNKSVSKSNDDGTVYDYLMKALKRRKDLCKLPLTVLCCDNLRDNGNMLRRNMELYLEAFGEKDLNTWMQDNVSFPSSMVDRITPKPIQFHSQEVEKKFGIRNDFTIHSEDFIQWVITDDFRGQRPELELAGVSFVKDVSPYEEAKIRILNGSHLGLVHLAALKGFDTYDKAVIDPELSTFFDLFLEKEVIPTLDLNGPIDLKAYARSVKKRFQNWQIADGLPRIAMDGYSKFRQFLLPTLEGCFDRDINPECSIKSVACWYVLLKKVADGSSSFNYQDPYFSFLKTFLQPGMEQQFARIPEIWCDLPQRYPQFPKLVEAEIKQLLDRFNE